MLFARAASAIVSQPAIQSTQLSGSFSAVTSNLYFALFDADYAESIARHALNGKYIVIPMTPISAICRYAQEGNYAKSFTPSSLTEIYRFDDIANQITRRNADHKLVFAAGRNPQVHQRAIFLIGCHVIMSHGFDVESTFSIFRP